ncbi:MAG: RdgB/HAM1 family non-canonical purine NTP pyrophosphatase [Candidatus Hydrogenedentota bacterium]
MKTIEVIVATTNKAKIKEIKRIIGNNKLIKIINEYLKIKNIDTNEIETARSFYKNALLKARVFADAYGVVQNFEHLHIVSDDSGLCVSALKGEPGINSSRYGGIKDDKERCQYLLKKLKNKKNRKAKFVCVLVLYNSRNDKVYKFRGEVRGKIASEPRGKNGFGYDPIFVPDEGDGRTFAEMEPKEKDELSHRARAIRKMLEFLS